MQDIARLGVASLGSSLRYLQVSTAEECFGVAEKQAHMAGMLQAVVLALENFQKLEELELNDDNQDLVIDLNGAR